MTEKVDKPTQPEGEMPTLPEAPASINFRGITASGWDVQITLRDTNEFALMDRFGNLVKKLEKWQVSPKGKSNGGNGSQPSEPPPMASDKPQSEQYFEAEKLAANMHEGKTYWKVKGGKFSQYGVTIWHEVLKDAGFDPDKLDPAKTYDIPGYTAYYVENDKGNPQKVITLAKA